ncbi:C-C chemokine receptor type 8 [Centroberyx affinis]|uniref:C-C chemokine receptor type 8 n=1 Tax=Centroberyx affinis TaxID=166261 RepID=UPI003A5BE3F8
MNATESEYDYYSCYQDPDSVLSDGSVVLPVLLYLLFGLGLLGNATVLWVLIRYMKLRSMTDVCLLNLALSDLILVLSLPLWAFNSHNQLGSDGPVPCKLMTGVYQLGLYSGTLFVTLMSMDRYLAIVHAVAAMRARTLRYGTAASIAIWVVSVILTIPQVVFAEMVEEDSQMKCQQKYPDDTARLWKLLRNFSENTVGLFVCLPIMAFCYVKILVVLHRSRNSKKDRAMKLIFTIVCVFVVCWVPYNVIIFLQTLQMFELLNNCETTNSIDSALGVAETIALAHCCANPVIYAFVGEKFRRSLGKVLSRYPCWKHLCRGDARDTEKETSNTPVKSDY